MIFENKNLPRLARLEANTTCEMTDVLQKLADMKIMRFCSCESTDDRLRAESKNIVIHYLQSSDLLQFISSATYHNAYSLKYKLEPPLTTSKLDSEFILHSLVKAGCVMDFYYSALSASFWIELDRHFSYTVNDIVSIGICELLDSYYDKRFNVELRSNTDNIWADVFIGSDKRINVFHVELAAGLEADVSSHLSQFEKLKSKIIKAKKRKTEYYTEYIIISPAVFKQLPDALQQVDNIITIDSIQDRLNLLDL